MNCFKFHNLILLLLAPLGLMSQEVLVLDGVSGFPLEGVALFTSDQTKATLTDENGQASLAVFSEKDFITVQFYGFESQQIQLGSEEYRTGVTLKLAPKDQTLDEVILSVARNATTRKQLAEKVAVIDAKTIALQRPATGAELVSLSPGVRIQKSQGGGGSCLLYTSPSPRD